LILDGTAFDLGIGASCFFSSSLRGERIADRND